MRIKKAGHSREWTGFALTPELLAREQRESRPTRIIDNSRTRIETAAICRPEKVDLSLVLSKGFRMYAHVPLLANITRVTSTGEWDIPANVKICHNLRELFRQRMSASIFHLPNFQ